MRKLILMLLLLCIALPASAALINVSEGKPATASSLWSGTNANMATDGVLDFVWPIYHSGGSDNDPWIMIDLESVELVKEVTLWNRVNCCWQRMQDIQVEILDANQHIVFISELLNPGNIMNITSYETGSSITLSLENTVPGQYVRVRRIPIPGDDSDNGRILSLNEVQVFADGEVASIAGAPSPYYGEVDVPLEVTLSWDASVLYDPNDEDPAYPNPDLIKHNLYLSSGKMSDPNLVLVAEILAGDARVGYGPITIERDGVYYWRVDQVVPDANKPGENKVITGGDWMFFALSSLPSIDEATPAEQIIDEGADAVFTVSAKNPFTGDSTGLSYAWFKVDPLGDIPVGGNSDTLTLVAPTADNEGDYYCIVTVNVNGNTATSKTANLTIKRLIHYWPFEGTMEDVVGGRDGVAVSDPDLSVPGVPGGLSNYAVDLDTNDAIHIPGDALGLNSYSISVWVNLRGLVNNFHSVIHQDGWSNDGVNGSLHWHLRNDQSFSWGINGAGGDGRTAAGVLSETDKWYHLVLSHRFGRTRAYVNGVIEAEVMAANQIGSRILPGSIGAWNQNDRFLNGRIDDLRIYNYPLSDIDIATLNFEATGVPVCVFPPEFDLNGDCLTTLEDFAIMAANWAKCNRVPVSECD